MLILQILLFALSIWLGLYLIQREPSLRMLPWIGAGVLIYALILATNLLADGGWDGVLITIGATVFVVDLLSVRLRIIELGEAFWPDVWRSAAAAALAVGLFAGPVALTMLLANERTQAMLLLLLVTIALAIASQIYASSIQTLLDQLVFRSQPQLQQERAELRTASESLPRLDEQINLTALSDEEFTKLTRRALSHYGDLPLLTASPLTHLPIIEQRLAARHATGHTLERATELKMLLLEAIQQLKPPSNAEFDSADAWRHYNSLYFPYVVGLRPYNSRSELPKLDAASRRALEWLQAQVPQRTLHNWQNSAAKLVATYLREAGK